MAPARLTSTTEQSNTQMGTPIKEGGFAQLARRISDWTSRSLLTAVILAAGLAFGRQVSQWWAGDGQDDPTCQPEGPADRLGEPAQPHLVQFGNEHWSVVHQLVSGSQETVISTLRARCREIAQQTSPVLESPSENEMRFFKSIVASKPVEQKQGRWALFEFPDPLPMVVATQPAAPDSPSKESYKTSSLDDRVVAWSIGVPAGQGVWTLLAFSPSRSATIEPSRSPELGLPPQCRRLLSLSVVGGGALISFCGPCEAKEWRAFFPASFEQSGGKVVEAWRPSGATWHLRGTVGQDRSPTAVDVWFGPDQHGGLSGLMIYTPSTSKNEGERS